MRTALAAAATALSLLANPGFAAEEMLQLETATGTLHGTLLRPGDAPQPLVALIVSGSGPTDRDGNNPMAGHNDALKLVAQALADAGIASLRYDKRGIAASAAAGADESRLRFDDYVDDAAAWAAQLARDGRFAALAIVGHSEGATIAALAVAKAPGPASSRSPAPANRPRRRCGASSPASCRPTWPNATKRCWRHSKPAASSTRCRRRWRPCTGRACSPTWCPGSASVRPTRSRRCVCPA